MHCWAARCETCCITAPAPPPPTPGTPCCYFRRNWAAALCCDRQLFCWQAAPQTNLHAAAQTNLHAALCWCLWGGSWPVKCVAPFSRWLILLPATFSFAEIVNQLTALSSSHEEPDDYLKWPNKPAAKSASSSEGLWGFFSTPPPSVSLWYLARACSGVVVLPDTSLIVYARISCIDFSFLHLWSLMLLFLSFLFAFLICSLPTYAPLQFVVNPWPPKTKFTLLSQSTWTWILSFL